MKVRITYEMFILAKKIGFKNPLNNTDGVNFRCLTYPERLLKEIENGGDEVKSNSVRFGIVKRGGYFKYSRWRVVNEFAARISSLIASGKMSISEMKSGAVYLDTLGLNRIDFSNWEQEEEEAIAIDFDVYELDNDTIDHSLNDPCFGFD